ncbi:MAG: hypothetical protein U7M05_12425, partial [Candidatus Igneacidithiobacillus chanchocoensis]
ATISGALKQSAALGARKMAGKHRNWHRRWIVDLAAGTATHDSGLIVRAARSPAGDAADFQPANLDEWQNRMRPTMPPPNLVAHARRMMREAVAVYQRAQEKLR